MIGWVKSLFRPKELKIHGFWALGLKHQIHMVVFTDKTAAENREYARMKLARELRCNPKHVYDSKRAMIDAGFYTRKPNSLGPESRFIAGLNRDKPDDR